MTQRATEILTAALQLSMEERLELYGRLEDSLIPPESDIDKMTEDEFAAELERRAEELRRDPSAAIPWEQVRDRR